MKRGPKRERKESGGNEASSKERKKEGKEDKKGEVRWKGFKDTEGRGHGR